MQRQYQKYNGISHAFVTTIKEEVRRQIAHAVFGVGFATHSRVCVLTLLRAVYPVLVVARGMSRAC